MARMQNSPSVIHTNVQYGREDNSEVRMVMYLGDVLYKGGWDVQLIPTCRMYVFVCTFLELNELYPDLPTCRM